MSGSLSGKGPWTYCAVDCRRSIAYEIAMDPIRGGRKSIPLAESTQELSVPPPRTADGMEEERPRIFQRLWARACCASER